jgi:bis(5'-nucleosyl)-tetraphosphatase (symmetrical)
MATYAIGDVQGCYDALQRLLEKIRFDPAADRLWFCGDLVNRGGQSLETLRLIHSLAIHSTIVLGNHDLSLLAISTRREADKRKVNADLQRVLFADDSEVLVGWLRRQKLIHVDRTLGFAMVHAEARAREVEEKLQGDGFFKLVKNMYGDKPAWSPKLAGVDRHRAIINVFTRLRYCTPAGRIGFEDKGRPGTQKPGMYPWFEVPGHAPRELPVVFGHWSTLGLFMGLGVYGIDTGAVWGGQLTAMELGPELRLHQVAGRDPPDGAPRGDD